MGVREWFRGRLLGGDAEGDDVPPSGALIHTLLGRDEERPRALGEYSGGNLPSELGELLRRRAEVSEQLLRIDVADRAARIAAIPDLQQMLRRYPHPLVYDMLINAYVDTGRYDEAKGLAFAARDRRAECGRSEFAEIRAEVDQLHDWSPADIDEMRSEKEAGK